MNQNGSIIIPTMRYKNAATAIEWLCNAFGFEKHLVVPGENETIVHAQLTFGNAMLMIASENKSEFDKLVKTPKAVQGFNTQSPYIIIEAIDAHYKKAISAGAKIVLDLKDEDHGGRGYSCKDPEGYIWNFGSYNPWV
ncbi:MAG: glyoxalase [Bacteroidetes bacterium MedPE-SWsnd-G2]|nr:MAG: glyoxalase [Bacteroidetes bacterium MedPE-SWsnd-G2]